MRRISWLLCAAFALTLSQGCKDAARKGSRNESAPPNSAPSDSKGANSDAEEPVPAIQDCGNLARAVCEQLEACTPFYLDAYYSGTELCESVLAEICDDLVEQQTPPDFTRCEQSLQGCNAVVESRGLPAFCWNPQGQVPGGGVCLRDTDCEVGLCQRAKSDANGTCVEPAAAGEECTPPVRCALGLRCDLTSATCVKPVEVGQHCDSPFGCAAGLACKAEGTCQPTQAGDACVAGIVPCSPGQSCVFDQCLESALVETDCKSASSECAGTARCVVQQLATFEQIAECKEAVRYDVECDVDTPCLEPLSCRGGRCAP